jgi:cytochrome P450
MGIDYLFALMPYGEEWKNHRRLFEQYFAPKDIKREEKRILDFVRKGLLPNIYQAPEDYLAHIKRSAFMFWSTF